MPILQTQTLSFLTELYQGIHVFGTDNFRMALYGATADLDLGTTVYTTAGEISGPGYTAGGQLLTGVVVGGLYSPAPGQSGAWVTFNNPTWVGALSARCALIYNASKANRSVAVLDFGAVRTSTTAFTVALPPPGALTAIIRAQTGA